MLILGLLLAGVSLWNFIVGMWIMGAVCAILAVWLLAEYITDF